jgi:hypothetical protein
LRKSNLSTVDSMSKCTLGQNSVLNSIFNDLGTALLLTL